MWNNLSHRGSGLNIPGDVCVIVFVTCTSRSGLRVVFVDLVLSCDASGLPDRFRFAITSASGRQTSRENLLFYHVWSCLFLSYRVDQFKVRCSDKNTQQQCNILTTGLAHSSCFEAVVRLLFHDILDFSYLMSDKVMIDDNLIAHDNKVNNKHAKH